MKETNASLTQMQSMIANVQQGMQIAKLFAIKYEAKIPEGLGILIFSDAKPLFIVSLEHVEDDDRNRALTAIGDIFGRSDWKAQIDYGGKFFDWKKVVDDVRIKISGAQKSGVPESFPVDPKQFPLQLENIS